MKKIYASNPAVNFTAVFCCDVVITLAVGGMIKVFIPPTGSPVALRAPRLADSPSRGE